MKVLQVIDTLNAGGAERVLVDISNILSMRNFEVTVLTVLKPGPLAKDLDPSVNVVSLNRTFKFNIRKAIEFITVLNGFEVVHIHMRHLLNYYWFCSLFKKCSAKIIFHDHFGDIAFDRRVPVYFKLLRSNIHYIGVSRQLCDWACNIAGIDEQKVFFLGNIVTLETTKKTFPKSSPGDQVKIVMISNFRRTKNIEFAIRLIPVLQARYSVQLDIYGRDQDKDYLKELEVLRDTCAAHSSVNFFINRTDIRYTLFQYDLALHCAHSETGPLVLIEYLASHIPFIAYETGEVPAQLKGHFPDFFIDNFDPEQWTSRIFELAGKDFAAKRSEFDRIFSMYYSKEVYGVNIENIYNVVN